MLMVDVMFIGQLVDSMSDAVSQLERAVVDKDTEKVNKLKIFIFDLHRQIGKVVGVKNV